MFASIAGSKKRVRAAPLALGAVKRHVGILEQLVRIVPVFGSECDADAGADDDLMPFQIVGSG